ncbi:MAG TPA: hypothetical protein VMV43_11045 [Candidatus Nanopelagicaceae bacterium]|nr:hypothetical protein [Candidatus Nanopelagicaceae bacterium]
MSEKNNKQEFLLLRELLNESLLRDLIIFVIFYLFILAQSWKNIFLLLFPVITYTFSLFFRLINANKWRLSIYDNTITYNPLGLEKKHANRLIFTAVLQLILLFWIGGESYYHPQLIQTYDFFFNIIFNFIYTFGFYWILIDIWKYSKITIKTRDNVEENSGIPVNHLNLKYFKLIYLINLGTFIFLNILNLGIVILTEINGLLGIMYILPGTGIESSLPLKISVSSFLIIVISPLIAILLFYLIYKNISCINPSELIEKLQLLPDSKKNNVIETLKNINHKYSRDFSSE